MKNSAVMALVFAMGCGVEHAPSGAQQAGSSGKADQGTQGGTVQTLSCSLGNFREFRATLDGTGYQAGSGYFDARDARVMDGYATAELICVGHRLEEIDCIGFWFGVASEVAEVTTTNGATGLTASHSSLRGDLVHMNSSPWPCTVQ